MTKPRRLTRKGKVAVILSNEEDGWFTQHGNIELVLLPELVELIETPTKYTINPTQYSNWCANQDVVALFLKEWGYKVERNSYGHWGYTNATSFHYLTGAANLCIEWVDAGSTFTIETEDRVGGDVEVIRYKDDTVWITV